MMLRSPKDTVNIIDVTPCVRRRPPKGEQQRGRCSRSRATQCKRKFTQAQVYGTASMGENTESVR